MPGIREIRRLPWSAEQMYDLMSQLPVRWRIAISEAPVFVAIALAGWWVLGWRAAHTNAKRRPEQGGDQAQLWEAMPHDVTCPILYSFERLTGSHW